MDPVTTSTAHSHHHPPPFRRLNFRFPFHPILHAPAPHLRSQYPPLRRHLNSEPELTTANQDNNFPQIPATVKDQEPNCRHRDLPSGSKSKSKPLITSIRSTVNSFHFHLLEISDGCDVTNSVAAFASRRQLGLCIVSGSGAVADVTIRQPGCSDTVVTLQGCFEILSISGSFLSSPPELAAPTGITVYLAGGHGEVVGGSVVGALRASGKVVVMALSFVNAEYESLPLEGEKAATDC